MPARCPWSLSTPDYIAYHDDEWGRPQHDDRVLFEFLILEGAQAGLSWRTILELSLIHISEPTRLLSASRMPSSA